MGSFTYKKLLKFVITLGTGKFGSSSANVITLKGFRSICYIDKGGGQMMGTLRAKIYGMSQSDMNSCVTLQWRPNFFIPNTIEVFAIDGNEETLVFKGNIINAWGDYLHQPDVNLDIQAQSAFAAALTPVPPRSFPGERNAGEILGILSADMGYSFEDNGVDVLLTDTYLANTTLDQAKKVAAAAGAELYFDDVILAATPRSTARITTIVPLINAKSGMIGYPTFDGIGIVVRTLYNPAIVFGGLIMVDSQLPQANGKWIVTSITHELSCEMPDGPWFSLVRGNLEGLAVVF